VLSTYRVFRGPTIPDRVVALDNIATNMVALIVVFSIRAQSALYIDVALVIAILSFLATVAAAKYLLRGTVIDGSPR
jgi:multicomponent Na+:H+ antiporter subunit F